MDDNGTDVTAGIVAAYVAALPTAETTPSIVKELSAQHNLSEAKVRARLVRAGVYVAQVKKGLSEKDKDWIRSYFEKKTLVKENRQFHLDAITKALNVEQSPVEFFLSWSSVGRREAYRPSEGVSGPPPKSGMSTGSQTRHYAEIAERLGQSTFEQRLNGEAGWFGNPLWILNSIVLLFVIALVIADIGSIF